MAIIRTENLSYIYSEGTPYRMDALHNVSFQVEKGESVGIIGHTGSGKSTLMQQLNGMLKPTSGRVFFEEKDIWEDPKKIRDVRFKVGLVFQYPEYQLFEETVEKDIAFGPKNMGLSETQVAEQVRRAADIVGLRSALLKKSPFDLSGGEKRRAAIAGVIAMNPRVLILDEPTAGLDPRGRDSILNRLLEHRRNSGTTLITVSHSMEDIAKLADRVIVMNKGEVAMCDKAEKIYGRGQELSSMGLTVPQVTKVFATLKKRGLQLDRNIITVEEGVEFLLPLLRKNV